MWACDLRRFPRAYQNKQESLRRERAGRTREESCSQKATGHKPTLKWPGTTRGTKEEPLNCRSLLELFLSGPISDATFNEGFLFFMIIVNILDLVVSFWLLFISIPDKDKCFASIANEHHLK